MESPPPSINPPPPPPNIKYSQYNLIYQEKECLVLGGVEGFNIRGGYYNVGPIDLPLDEKILGYATHREERLLGGVWDVAEFCSPKP